MSGSAQLLGCRLRMLEGWPAEKRTEMAESLHNGRSGSTGGLWGVVFVAVQGGVSTPALQSVSESACAWCWPSVL